MCARSFLPLILAASAASSACSATDPAASTSGWSSATVGLFHTCGIFDGNAYCFGDDRTGQLGAASLGNTTCQANGFVQPCRAQPARTEGPVFTVLGSGRMQTCGVGSDGTWCWGSGLANGASARTDVPVRLTATRYVTLAARSSTMCGLTASGEVQCWADGASFPAPVTTYSVQLATLSGTYTHMCGLTSSGDAYCWGTNAHGELGTGDTTARSAPVPVLGALKFAKISAGFARTCAIAANHKAYCTGATIWTWTPQPDDAFNSKTFAPVAGNDQFTSITVGGGFACGVTTSGEGKCWGDNGNKLLGIGGASGMTDTPQPIAGGHRFRDIVAGAYHACGITVEGEMYCWGFDHAGQLGSLGFPVTCTLSDEFYACTGTPVLVPKPE